MSIPTQLQSILASVPNVLWWREASLGGTFQLSTGSGTAAVADNDPVGFVPDQTGNYPAIQATAGSRPLLRTGANGINGLPVLSLDGVDDYLTWGNPAGLKGVQYTELTMVWVVQQPFFRDYQYLGAKGAFTFYLAQDLFVRWNETWQNRNLGTSVAGVPNVYIYKRRFIVNTQNSLVAEETVKLNGKTVLHHHCKKISASVDANADWTLGATTGGGNALLGLIAGDAAIQRYTTDAEDDLIASYFCNRYGATQLSDVKREEKPLMQCFHMIDSLTQGDVTNYPDIMASLLPFRVETLNFGVYGQALDTATAYSAEREQAMPRKGLRVAFVWGGTNNLSGGQTGAAVHALLQTYCLALKAAGFYVIVMDCIPRASFDAGQEAQRQAFNTLIAANWQTYADRFGQLTARPIFLNQASASNGTYYVDGTHLNGAGYTEVALTAQAQLLSLARQLGVITDTVAVQGALTAQGYTTTNALKLSNLIVKPGGYILPASSTGDQHGNGKIFSLPLVTGRGGGLGLHETGSAQSNGADTTATYRQRRTIVSTVGNVSALQLVFANEIAEGQPSNDITVQASVVIGGAILPLTFGGCQSVVIRPGGIVKSDPLYIPWLQAGDTLDTLTNVSVEAGGVWALGNPALNNTGDGLIIGTNAVLTNTGLNQADAYSYGPVAVMGVTSIPGTGVAIVGDSIGSGNGDSGHEYGFAVRAANTAGVGFVRISLPGEQASQFEVLAGHIRRARFLSGIPTVLCNYGINDVNGGRTAAQIKTSLINIWRLAKLAGVQKVYQTTLTPGEFAGATEAVRSAINTWLRSGTAMTENPLLLDGVFDVAARVESATDGGAVLLGGAFWAAGMKFNFLHPSEAGHTAMALAVTSAALTAAKTIVDDYHAMLAAARAEFGPELGTIGTTGTSVTAIATAVTAIQTKTDTLPTLAQILEGVRKNEILQRFSARFGLFGLTRTKTGAVTNDSGRREDGGTAIFHGNDQTGTTTVDNTVGTGSGGQNG